MGSGATPGPFRCCAGGFVRGHGEPPRTPSRFSSSNQGKCPFFFEHPPPVALRAASVGSTSALTTRGSSIEVREARCGLAAYKEVGCYRGTAAICGVDRKTAQRALGGNRDEGQLPGRAPLRHNYEVDAGDQLTTASVSAAVCRRRA
jgi:hypothetical protein